MKVTGWLVLGWSLVGLGVLLLAVVLDTPHHGSILGGLVGVVFWCGLGLGVIRYVKRWQRRAETQLEAWDRAETAGLEGEATVTRLEQTGASLNENPVCKLAINVSLPDHAVYEVTSKMVIPQTELSRYAPGAVFPCHVSPDDLSVVSLDDPTQPAGSPAVTTAEIPDGLTGTATLQKVLDAGQPCAWTLALRVEVGDGRPPYEIQLATTPPAGIPRPRKGTRFSVKVDPKDPHRIAIDWSAQAVGNN